jgi:hypothetical protein
VVGAVEQLVTDEGESEGDICRGYVFVKEVALYTARARAQPPPPPR